MSKKTDKPDPNAPRPDEPKPTRPMQPVMEPAPEPDPATRAPRPESHDATTQGEDLIDAERDRIEKAKADKAAKG